MSHKNHSDSSCNYAEQLISYLYGEADENDKAKFETHLKNCSNCADELTGFGFVRSSVLDWKATDFSKLETPAFDVPAVKSEKSFLPAAVSTDSLSWFAGIKNLFSFNPALAALAILIACVGAALFAFDFANKTDFAKNETGKNPPQAAVSPTSEVSRIPTETNVTVNDSKKASPVVDSNNIPQPAPRERAAEKVAVKVTDISPKNIAAGSPRSSKNTSDNGKKTAPVRKEKVPNLNDIEEDEDKSIRLTDLFEEIDTK